MWLRAGNEYAVITTYPLGFDVLYGNNSEYSGRAPACAEAGRAGAADGDGRAVGAAEAVRLICGVFCGANGIPQVMTSQRKVHSGLRARALVSALTVPPHAAARVQRAVRVRRPVLNAAWMAGLSFARCHAERRVPNDPHMPQVLHAAIPGPHARCMVCAGAQIFWGEEMSRAARLWTHGYDLYRHAHIAQRSQHVQLTALRCSLAHPQPGQERGVPRVHDVRRLQGAHRCRAAGALRPAPLAQQWSFSGLEQASSLCVIAAHACNTLSEAPLSADNASRRCCRCRGATW